MKTHATFLCHIERDCVDKVFLVCWLCGFLDVVHIHHFYGIGLLEDTNHRRDLSFWRVLSGVTGSQCIMSNVKD